MFKCLATIAVFLTAVGCATNPNKLAGTAEAGKGLTVVCYNIRIGAGPEGPFGSESPTGTLQAIADYLLEKDADIVLLQEVDRNTTRVKNIDELEFLAKATAMESAWGKTTEIGGGEYGIGILSKHPLRDVQVQNLFRPDYSKTNPEWPGWYAEQRVALSLVVDTPDGPVQVVNTHLGITEDQRAEQFKELAAIVREMDPQHPIILGGDLNAKPEEAALGVLRDELVDTWTLFPVQPTFSALKPERTIDYIFVSKNLKAESLSVDPVQHSDHLPIVVRVAR